MPSLPLLKLALVAGLVAAFIPAGATAAPSPKPRPDHPVLSGRTNAAERALEAVTAAFRDGEDDDDPNDGQGVAARPGHRGGEITQQLIQLRLGLDDLSPRDRELAEIYLARPTDGTEWDGANYGPRARPTNDCRKSPTRGSEICVHWARRTADAPPARDADSDGLPNQVERTRDAMRLVWGRVVDAGGYQAPLADEGKGFDDRLDIYLVDFGSSGLYGYCSPENVGQGRSAAAYCVLDDDYAARDFRSGTPTGNLRVTAAHEFFHAVQFGYDVREDGWLMETTSTWIEDEIFDGVNDNRYYLGSSVLRFPERSLDTQALWYGNWIWWRYLTERFPAQEGGLPVLVREVWERAQDTASSGTYSMDALAQTLSDDYGQRLGRVFADFSNANRMPADPATGIYEEGEAYFKAPLSAVHRLDSATRPTVPQQGPALQHMSATTVAFIPDSGYAGDLWTIDIAVNLPGLAQNPSAQITVFDADGSVDRDYIGLSSEGIGSYRADFGRAKVDRVELTLTNGNHSYDCNEGTRWSCQGVPAPERPFAYSATTAQDAP